VQQPEDDDDGNRCKEKQPGEKGDVYNSFIKKIPQSGFHGSIGESAGNEEEDGGRTHDFVNEGSLRCPENIDREQHEKAYAEQHGGT
jgi:hypothetical protein